jgi:predicted alpha/beta hydrolase
VLTSGDAGQGASALRPLVTALARHGQRVALLCHSYGSVVCGLAAPHLPVADIAVFGSPGMDAASARALHTAARVWAGRGSGDWIRSVPHVHLLGLGFGSDPVSPGFGARPFGCGSAGHSGYFRPGGLALRNLAYIALGEPGKVTR